MCAVIKSAVVNQPRWAAPHPISNIDVGPPLTAVLWPFTKDVCNYNYWLLFINITASRAGQLPLMDNKRSGNVFNKNRGAKMRI